MLDTSPTSKSPIDAILPISSLATRGRRKLEWLWSIDSTLIADDRVELRILVRRHSGRIPGGARGRSDWGGFVHRLSHELRYDDETKLS